ncbi:MAG: fused MFS/spermidine synthase [Planctomycetes bacterium]|nr:fused MFS/spermidine synthase [Planctomycetota bacterium]MBI3846842.1 fused MFS/spermidine synthase [Planctomycetota bacterium]
MTDKSLRRLIFVLFFLSGTSALVYEVVWTRMLGRIMGNSVWSITTVLTAFMGGLAIGSYVAGRVVDRVQDARKVLRAYGWLEGAIGLYCLAIPLIERGVEPVYRLIYQNLNTGTSGSFYAFSLVRFVVGGLLLVLPTTLMGATLPILSRYFVDRFDKLGSTVGRLYAVNTFGAVAGAFVSGFVLVRALGEQGTIFAAVAVNLVIAATILAVSKPAAAALESRARAAAKATSLASAAAPTTAAAEPTLRTRPQVLALLVAFGLAGGASMIYQVAWTRLISLVIGSTVYAFSLMVTAFILGLAIGGSLFSTFIDKRKNLLVLLATVEALIALSAMALIGILGELPLYVVDTINHFGSDFWTLQTVFFGGIFLLILVPTVMMGGAFPIVSKIYTRSLADVGRSVGTVYSFNTLGSIIGAFVAGFVLIPNEHLRLQGTLEVGIAVNVLVAVIALLLSFQRYPIRPYVFVPAAIAIGAFFLLALVKPWTPEVITSGAYVYAAKYKDDIEVMRQISGEIDQSKSDHELLRTQLLLPFTEYYKEGVSATVAVRRDPDHGHIFLSINGKTDASNDADMLTQVLAGHLPMLFHGSAKDVCVVGLGSGVTLGSVLQYPVERVDSVEISPEVYEGAKVFANDNHHALDDPRVRQLVEDGRNHLNLTNRTYDVIASEPSNPWISGIGALFTRQFFEICRDHLNAGGVMCQWTNTYDMLPDEFRMVLGTFRSVFTHVTLWESVVGGDYLVVGSMDEKPIDLSKFTERMADAKVASDLGRVGIKNSFDLLARFVMGGEDLERYSAAAPIHTDDNNRLEFTVPRNMYNRDRFVIQLQDLVENRRPVQPFLTGLPSDEAERRAIRDRLQKIYDARVATLQGLLHLRKAVRSAELGVGDPAGVDEAERLLEQAVALNPSDIEAPRELFKLNQQKSQWLVVDGHLEESIPCFERMIALEPDNNLPRRNVSLVLRTISETALSKKEIQKAIDFGERAVKADAKSALAQKALAEAKWAAGDKGGAIRAMGDAKDLDPNDAKLLDRFALFNFEGHPKPEIGCNAAVGAWIEASKIDPANVSYRLNLGLALTRLRRYEEAVNVLQPLSLKQPNDAIVQLSLGNALRGLQDFDRARAAFERCLALEPNGARAAEAHMLLACSLAARSETGAALDELDRATSLGFKNYTLLLKEPNLSKLRSQPRFEALVKKLATAAPAATPGGEVDPPAKNSPAPPKELEKTGGSSPH